MKDSYVHAEVVELDSGQTQTELIPLAKQRDDNAAALRKSLSHQQTDDARGTGRKFVEYRFPLKAVMDLLDQNVWHARCVRLKAKLTVGMGYRLVNVEDPEDKGESDPVKKDIEAFLRRPNDRHYQETFQRIMDKFAIDYNDIGNAYLEVSRNLRDKPAQLWHVRGATMRRDRNIRGGGYWQVINLKRHIPFAPFGGKRNAGQNEIIHFYEYDPKDDYYGLPAWYPALADMMMDRSTVEYMINTFRNQLVAKFLVIVEGGKLSNTARTNLRSFLQKNATGIQAGGSTLVFDSDDPNVKIRIEKLEVSFGEKGNWYKDTRGDARDHIITAHGVPPRMVGVMSSGQLGGGGEVMGQLKTFVELEIKPDQNRIEDMLNNTIISLFGEDHPWRIEFNTPNVSDEKELAETIRTLRESGIIIANEGRKMWGLDEMDDESLLAQQGQDSAVFMQKLRKAIEQSETALDTYV